VIIIILSNMILLFVITLFSVIVAPVQRYFIGKLRVCAVVNSITEYISINGVKCNAVYGLRTLSTILIMLSNISL